MGSVSSTNVIFPVSFFPANMSLPPSLPERSTLSLEYLDIKVKLFRKKRDISRLRRKILDIKSVRTDRPKYFCDPKHVQELLDAHEDFHALRECLSKQQLRKRKRAQSLQIPRGSERGRKRAKSHPPDKPISGFQYLRVPVSSALKEVPEVPEDLTD